MTPASMHGKSEIELEKHRHEAKTRTTGVQIQTKRSLFFARDIIERVFYHTIHLPPTASAKLYIGDTPLHRPLVIILPGGNYLYTTAREKRPVVDMFAEHGYHAAVLNYTTYLKDPTVTVARLVDEVNALLVALHDNASRWRINTHRIFLCGFSAGGHLAAIAGNRIGKSQLRGVILCYPAMGTEYIRGLTQPPVTSMPKPRFVELFRHRPIDEVSINTPPTFLWHTARDMLVSSRGSIDYATRLLELRVPCELHVYQHGQHALSVATAASARTKQGVNRHVATWATLACSWIEAQK